MNLYGIDLEKELQKSKRKENANTLITEVNSLLEEGFQSDIQIQENIKSKRLNSILDIESFNPKNIYTLEQIRGLCIKYRLRFLDASSFKGEIPYEALLKVKDIQKDLDIELSGFKIIAPKEMFHLRDKDSDPILFLQITERHYYFIHKWGGEINRLRSVLAFPFRNINSMLISLFAMAFLVTLMVPTNSAYLFIFLLVHSFIGICGLACLLIFSMRQNLSNIEWDSKYYS